MVERARGRCARWAGGRDGGINGVPLVWEECETVYDVTRGVECYEHLKIKGPAGAAAMNLAGSPLMNALTERATHDQIPLIATGLGRADASDGRVFPYVFNPPSNWWSQNTAKLRFLGQQVGGMAQLKGLKIAQAWAGLSPGNNASAGKRRKGRTRRGNRYLRRVLVQWAWATRKTSTFLGRTFRRLEARLGGKKAAVAVAHKILVIIYHLLLEGTFYEEDRYDRLLPRQEERERQRALKGLERLGYAVTLDKVA